jgi:signal transduction histidine kinase
VRVTRLPAELTLRIENEICAAGPRDGIGLGQGIRGMQERARTLGGVVEAGPAPDGRFHVVARLPLPAGLSASPGMSE